uniref:phospholipase A2 n=1 Tax=Sinocyclocheilus anshuiensis TaxID=1608454 RepID=A0A671SPF6_9TELE
MLNNTLCAKSSVVGEYHLHQVTDGRGFTYPGTLWCGAGNIADHYDQLGEFEETDKCCRVHDHCPYVIHAFSSNYGYTNFKWHPLSHCDCDNALKECLRRVNDTSSRVVGQAFFNVIEVPCFEFSFEEQCVDVQSTVAKLMQFLTLISIIKV